MLAHYAEYGDVAGDSFLNLVATTLPLDAYLVTGRLGSQEVLLCLLSLSGAGP